MLLSSLLFQFFSKLPSHSPLNTMSCSHTELRILLNSDNSSFHFYQKLSPLSNSPHSLNFFHPILILAVTAASLPPLAFNLSPPNNKSSSQSQPGKKIIFLHLVSQFLPLYQCIVHKQNLLPRVEVTLFYFYSSTMYPFTTLRTHH